MRKFQISRVWKFNKNNIKNSFSNSRIQHNPCYYRDENSIGLYASADDFHYANTSYKEFNQTLSLDLHRINRVSPRITTFFKKHFLRETSVEQPYTKGNKPYDQQNNQISNIENNKYGQTKHEKVLGRRKLEVDTSRYPDSGKGSGDFEGRSSRSFRTDDYSSEQVSVRRTGSEKSFGTVRYQLRKSNSNPQTLVLKTTNKEDILKKKNILNNGALYRKPWISSVLRSNINSSLPESLGQGWVTIRYNDVASSDAEAIRAFTTENRHCNRCLWVLLFRSGSAALKNLTGFLESHPRQKFDLVKPSVAVENLAKDTNSGFPLFVKKNTKEAMRNAANSVELFLKHPCLSRMLGGNVAEVKNVDDGFILDGFAYVQVIFHRLQVSVNNKLQSAEVKIRQVWCVPYFIVTMEYMFFNPIIEHIRNMCLTSDQPLYTTGMNAEQISKKAVARLRRKLSESNNGTQYICQGDYSKFDQTIPADFGFIFFKLIGEYINMTRREKITFDFLRVYFKYSPFVYDSELYIKQRGVSSGSYITNFYDTFVNITLILCCKTISENLNTSQQAAILSGDHIKFGWTIEQLIGGIDKNCQISENRDFVTCGDDIIWITDKVQNEVMTLLCKTLDMQITFSDPVTSAESEIFFLGRFWNANNEPFQTELYLVAHSLFRTKFYDKTNINFNDEEELEIYRILSIYTPFINGWDLLWKHYGRWKRFVEFVTTRDNFKLLKEWPYASYPTIAISDSKHWNLVDRGEIRV